MNGRIGLLHCGYRVVGDPGSAAGTVARLDRLVQQPALRAMADALDQALGDDPTVYVLRKVRSSLVLGAAQEPDGRLARRWGEHLARSVLEAVVHDDRDGANLVRFSDEADHVAQFLGDLLEGHAWDRWFHARFSALRDANVGGAASAVLLEHRKRLPAILNLLQQRGVLDRLMGLLDDDTLRLLWRGDEDGEPATNPETARPVFLAALDLIDRLELWSGQRPDTATLWRAWLATGQQPPDWRDRAELEATLIDAIRLLADRGHLRPPPHPGGRSFQARLEAALDGLDWLAGDALRSSLVALLTTRRPGPPLPLPPLGRGETPRQRQLLADLAQLVRSGVRIGDGLLDSTGTALRLHAALVAACPRWQDEPMARTVIQRLLAAAAGPNESDPVGDSVTKLGPDGAAVVLALTAHRSGERPGSDLMVHTRCAGAFLLLRGAIDDRLPGLVDRLGAPPIGAVLLGLALRWSGRAALVRGRIDPGLAVLAGPGYPGTLDNLRAAWKAVGREQHRRWQAELLALPGLAGLANEAELDALTHGRLMLKSADRTLALGGLALLRGWARWLRGFSSASASYLLDSFVRRPGQVTGTVDDLLVRLEPRPLDVVLALAGYTDELDLSPLYGRGRLRFQVAGS